MLFINALKLSNYILIMWFRIDKLDIGKGFVCYENYSKVKHSPIHSADTKPTESISDIHANKTLLQY